ncbi:unnamed protein product [Nezara viridula]|uniref:Protein male-specific lethal-3 n=1 Tax=Nezara viridula TaxID=85310 RepID=A0A9P0HHB5_NEZVI|nr:unnamed protein product [Nezara viridula]
MVSTRSVKHKFSEGEKVLCYEPDPAKTKVLYNSKVLGIGEKKDESGKKVVHFLIHFQGWNSTWDRFVTEDYILKDTEENRKLQKELAEKAQLTSFCVVSGGNLYRRGRKRRTLSRTGSDNEKRGGESDSEGEAGGGVQTTFSPGLQALLDTDHSLINNSNKLVKLPASPNAVEILEAYMKDFTINQIRLLCHKRGHLRPTAGKNAHMTVAEIFIRANLCREVADGLRVYIDFMTELSLLYPQERSQFNDFTTKTLSLKPIKKEEKNETKEEPKDEPEVKHNSPVRETDRKKSLRSHTETNVATTLNNTPLAGVNNSIPLNKADASQKSDSMPQVKAENHVSQTKQDGHASQNKLDGVSVDLASFLGHDVVKGGENLVLRPMSQRERDLLKKLVNRKLVPDWFLKQQGSEGNPIAPCLVYGAVHLARALVKIPEIFPHAEHSESKMNSITEYLNGFTKFLEDHPEWFADNQYCDNTYSQVIDNAVMKMEIS